MKQTRKPVSLFALATALFFLAAGTMSTQAQVLTNDFTQFLDYVANGIIGDTNFDGVYLNTGDIPFGPGFNAATRSGDGAAKTLAANTLNVPAPVNATIGQVTSALEVAQTEGDMAGASDSYFFLWKAVSGDFSVSVRSLPPWQTTDDIMAGPMVRAYNTNQTGAPVSFDSTNQNENSIANLRFDDFSINNPRLEHDGAEVQASFADTDATGVNSRMFRIDRIQLTNFYLYWATNIGDPWTPITAASITNGLYLRPDLTNAVMQVGIGYSAYGANTATTGVEFFDSFQITPLNVAGGTPGNLLRATSSGFPTAATGIGVTASNITGTATLTWTPGTNANGSTANSMVIVRPNANIIAQPISGLSLPLADPNLADVLGTNQNNAQYNASNNIVVYEGNGNSVTVSGLLNNLNTYSVAVYSYSNTSTNIPALTTNAVFNTAIGGTTATNSFAGPGIITSITANVGPSAIPIGGVGFAVVTGNFSTGGSAPLASSTVGLSVTSDTPSVISVVGSTLQALASGSAHISVSLTTSSGTLTAPNVLVTTHNVTFTDNFTNVHDYVANRLAGSTWDGLYLNYGDNPTPNGTTGQGGVGVNASTQVMGASTSSSVGPSGTGQTNALYISASASDWGNTPGGTSSSGSDGPFLFKNVPGDFEVWCHITNMGTINADCLGLMARFYVATPSAGAGGRTGPAASGFENHVNLWKVQDGAVDSFAVLRYTTSEDTDSAGVRTSNQTTNGGNTVNTWLLMQRFQGTNFYFYTKSATNDNWGPIGYLYVDPTGASLPLQVGIAEQMQTAAASSGAVDNFNLDATNIETSAGTDPTGHTNAPPAATALTAAVNANLSATFSWTAASNGATPVASILVVRQDLPVNETPYYGEILTAGPYNHPFGQAGDNIGSSNYAVWRSADAPASTINSVTITGLSFGHTYYAQVYTYDGTGSAILFNNDSVPNSAAFVDGTASGIEVVIPSIPVSGLSRIQVLEQFLPSTGTVDVTPSFTAFSSDPTTIQVTNGLASGIKVGTANITNIGTLNGVLQTNVTAVTVRQASYTDNFSVNHDYLQLGVTNTIWDGIYAAGAGYIPEQVTQGSTGVATTVLATNVYVDTFVTGTNATGGPVAVTSTAAVGLSTNIITLNNVLVVTNVGGAGWEAPDDGFFMFKVVPGDFQMVVHLDDYNGSTAYVEEGIMARAFSNATNAADITSDSYNFPPGGLGTGGTTNFAPLVLGTNANGSRNQGEYWVSLNRFDQFAIGTYAREDIDNVFTQSTQSGGPTGGINQYNSSSNGADGKSWLMIQRVNYTNFYFYAKKLATGPWLVLPSATSYQIAQMAGLPMQAGIADMPFNPVASWVKFDSFMLDAAPTSITVVNNGNGTVTLSWPFTAAFAHLYSSTTVPNKFTLVSGATITTANGISSTTVPIGTTGDLYYEVGP